MCFFAAIIFFWILAPDSCLLFFVVQKIRVNPWLKISFFFPFFPIFSHHFSNIFEYFRTFLLKIWIFSNVFDTFRTFLNVFERFFLTHFTYSPHPHTSISLFSLRAEIPLRIRSNFPQKIPHFKKLFQKSHTWFCFLLLPFDF